MVLLVCHCGALCWLSIVTVLTSSQLICQVGREIHVEAQRALEVFDSLPQTIRLRAVVEGTEQHLRGVDKSTPQGIERGHSCGQFTAQKSFTAHGRMLLRSAPPGADPTGVNDSSVSLNKEIRRLCANALPWQNVELNLGNGIFRLDEALTINSSVIGCSGKLRISDGTLVAGANLGARGANESYLLMALGYWASGVEFARLVLACNHTSGGLRVDSAGHVHLFDSKIVNFATRGVWGSHLLPGSGHDLVIARCLFTECTKPMADCADIRGKRGTGLLLEFPDSHVRNSVFTCSKAGVVNRGGSNTFTDVHIWTSCTGLAPYSSNTTVGFSEEGGATRLSSMQLDNSRLVISHYRGTSIIGSQFQGTGRLELVRPQLPPPSPPPRVNQSSPICEYWRGALCGLQVVSNRFICTTSSTCAAIDASALGSVPSARWVSVVRNAFEDARAALCSARRRCSSEEECAGLFQSGERCDA
jgi:hypothetical protein